MAIQRSAAAEIRELLATLAHGEAVVRDTAAARLCTIGPRVVPHVLDAFRASSSGVARTAMMKILEATRDRRGLVLAIDVLRSVPRDPAVAAAAIGLLGAFLDDDSTEALEALGTAAVDPDRPDLERLAAWQTLERMPERVLAPLRRRLQKDGSGAMVRASARARPEAPNADRAAIDPAGILDMAAEGGAVDPALVRLALDAAGRSAPLSTLNRLVERARAREDAETAAADRAEWLFTRAAAHLALAKRDSRVAVYDIRDTLAAAPGRLPEGFAVAVGLVGDAACLDAIAEALARVPAQLTPQEEQWRERLVEAGRAILVRERLTRRHGAVKRLSREFPDVAAVLLAQS